MSYFTIKRCFDFLAVLALFLLTLPFFFIILFFISLILKENPFFSQHRLGSNQKPFVMYKFKTMRTGAHRPYPHAFVSFLRKTGMDELPQLFNVFKGEMSFVGPRPLPVYYQKMIREEHYVRFKVLPGITGLTQVSGDNQLSWRQRFETDNQYVLTAGFRNDLSILVRTLHVIITSKKTEGVEPLTADY